MTGNFEVMYGLVVQLRLNRELQKAFNHCIGFIRMTSQLHEVDNERDFLIILLLNIDDSRIVCVHLSGPTALVL
jgi:hypothetical protein